MFGLAYVSDAQSDFSTDEIIDIAVKATSKNRQLGITGFLRYRDKRFFQYVEGDKESVLYLMDIIRDDSRHMVLNITHLPDVGFRRFDDWYMRYIPQEKFVALDLISLLEKHLVNYSKAGMLEKDYVDKRVIRLVSRIADHHHKFPNFFQS